MLVLSGSILRRTLHPLHAILLAFPLSMFPGALLSDVAYWETYHVQWSNFSSWLIVGGMIGATGALLWALVGLVLAWRAGERMPIAYVGVLLVMWVLGFINALVHAKDAWATMPEGLYLSAATTILALVAAWRGYSGFRIEEVG
ncbi:DUF2231 domain-containing protein [Enterovirga sp. CN4-39]|uniref:DUF2231 domain-containing protein n=1 Tax=Enterovirga sp. CN4-39 TaxID=3400910 RepID=UPI003C119202